MPRLFEQPINATPDDTKRVAFGKAGDITENMTLAELVTYMQNNLTLPSPVVTLDIGGFDMRGFNSKAVNYTAPAGKKVVGFSATIVDDLGVNHYNIESTTDVNLVPGGNIRYIDDGFSPRFSLYAEGTGHFNSSDFASTAASRGTISFFLIDV